ncbi:MAG: tetratricopeptide repeat protein [Lentisphaerae bacterium]|nr:tetratricopeptide repeat protein [Lentisphaerota bacterium]
MSRPGTSRLPPRARRRLVAWTAPLLCAGAAFTLSCRLAVLAPPPAGDTSLARQLLGEGRTALSSHFFRTADLYFHRGVAHMHDRAFTNDPFQRVAAEISPRRHVHTHGQSVAEIMPWLEFATRADPHNVEAYLVAAFWLAGEVRRPDAALRVLREAQAHNPRDYRIQVEKGRLFLHQGLRQQAADAFDAALAFWPGDADPESRGARHDKAEMLLYRALLYETEGRIDRAAQTLEALLRLRPGAGGIAERLAALRAGTAPEGLASEKLSAMLQANREERLACPREDKEHPHHPH